MRLGKAISALKVSARIQTRSSWARAADGHDDGVEDTERLQNPIPEQEYCGTFPVHAPAEDGGEGEHDPAKSPRWPNPRPAGRFQRPRGQRSALSADGGPFAGDEDGETGHAAHDHGGDEHVEHSDGGLPERGGGRGGVGDGPAAEPGFVGEDAPRHTEPDGHHGRGPGEAPLRRRGREGFLNDVQEHRGHFLDVQNDDEQRGERVQDRHKGHYFPGHAADAPQGRPTGRKRSAGTGSAP